MLRAVAPPPGTGDGPGRGLVVVILETMPENSTTILVERAFEVACPVGQAWTALGDVAGWSSWAPHIRRATVTPKGSVTATTSGEFRFWPVGRSRFTMTAFDPPQGWTWSGRVMGVDIDYDHRFEPRGAGATKLTWVVRTERPGFRARLFAGVYSRLIDRAWPRFVASVS